MAAGYVALVRALGAQPVLITARPSFVEARTYKSLAKYGLDDAVVLSGALRDSLLIPVAKDHCNVKIAERKCGGGDARRVLMGAAGWTAG